MIGENAALLELNGPGTPDSYADVPTKGPSLWSGRAPAYLKRERRRTVSGGEVILVERDVLTVRRETGAPPIEVPGDQQGATTVLVEDRRSTPVTRRFRVISVDNRAAGTIADAIRLELTDERAS